MRKTIKVGDKIYELKEVDSETPEVEEEVEEEDEVEEEVPATETPAPSAEFDDSKLDAVAEKIVAQLGLDKLHKRLDDLASEKETPHKKISALMDLEALMNKSVKEMTTKEKVVGFFQAMVQSNHAVLKALSEGTAADGGYLFPDEFRAEVIRDMAEQQRLRNEVTVIPMRRDILKVPSLESRPLVTWTEENATKSTTTAHFGEVTLTVKKMAAILYASDELIDDSAEVDVVNFIIGLFSEAIGEEEDRVIAQGNGTTEPTGLTTAQTAGTIAGRAVAGNLDYDDLIDLMYDLPSKYHANAKFYSHRANVRELRKLKDTNGRYLWQEPVSAGQPSTLAGYPVVEVNSLPEATIFFGDLKKAYWLGDRQRMTVKISQDTETAFTKDQTAIRVVSRIAGNVVLGQAVKALINIP
ncbi:MAG: phage major capsid protein [Bacteriovoracaceae bacterium]